VLIEKSEEDENPRRYKISKSGFIKGGTMLKRILKQKRYFKNIYKEQKGITGLETAIILIAFVVVAAVFAYTVLSAGLFSTQKSQEAVYNGLQETQNTLVVKGAVLSEAEPKYADTCEDAADWIVGEGGADSAELTILHEGTGSIKLTADGQTANNETLGTSATAAVTVATGDTITFWAKLGAAALYTDKVGFAIDTAAADCDGTADTLVAIDADDTDWHLYTVEVDVANNGQTVYYGVYVTADIVANVVYVDDIQVNNVSLWQSDYDWTPYASSIVMVLSLPTGGQAIDFSAGTDTNSNGLFDDASKTNKIVVNYNDTYQHFADVAWTGSFIGNNNSDYMLDPGEKIKITISLEAINAGSYDVDANHQFTLELKAPKGAILSLQRTMPARLYGIDNLN
jgi:flagellin-like protein